MGVALTAAVERFVREARFVKPDEEVTAEHCRWVFEGVIRAETMQEADIHCLLDCVPYLSIIHFVNSELDDGAMSALADSQASSRFTHLHFYGTKITRAGAKALAKSTCLENLAILRLNSQIGRVAVKSIARNPRFEKLWMLCLGGAKAGDTGAEALAQSPHLERVTCLTLHDSDIGERGFKAIAESESFRNLDSLSLSRNMGNAKCCQWLANAKFINNLKILYLQDNYIGDLGAEYLANALTSNDLQYLDFSLNDISDRGAVAIASMECKSEFFLSLRRNEITAVGIKAIADAPIAQALYSLSITDNPVGDEGAIAIANSDNFQKMRTLFADQCGIKDRGALALIESESLSALDCLYLDEDSLSPGVREKLRNRFPNDGLTCPLK